MKVLYIASNPEEHSSLNLEREITEFQRSAVANSGEAPQFIFLPSLPFEELPIQISRHKPDVLHISAHGEEEGLSLAHEGRDKVLLTSEMLCAFLDVDPAPRLVYLNSCNSEALANEITKRVQIAIGTTAPITNRAARKAAVAFYVRVLEGKSVARSFEVGRMIMKGLDKNRVTSKLFTQAGVAADKVTLHAPTRIVARFYEDRTKPKGRDYSVELGISGCPRNTIQVVFFTDDETFIVDEDDLEHDLCAVIRTTPIDGQIWMNQSWETYGDLRVFACGVTAGGEHFSTSGALCTALEEHYVSTRGVGSIGDLPAYLQGAIATLRRMGRP